MTNGLTTGRLLRSWTQIMEFVGKLLLINDN